jgi:hypothetical protein
MNQNECAILDLPRMTDGRGSLSVVEAGLHIPFELQRVFYLYGVPGGQRRAGHALRVCHQFIIAIAGSFDVVVDDGKEKQRFRLDRPDCGLHVPPMIWREIEGFSEDSVCLVLASEHYDPEDYLDEYSEFRKAVAARQT